MGINTKIKLPLGTAKITRVQDVIYRVLGHPTSIMHTDGAKDAANMRVRVKQDARDAFDAQYIADPAFGDYGRLFFNDPVGERYIWQIYDAIDDDESDMVRGLNIRFCSFSALVGTKLVEFFGGQIIYNDCYDVPDLVIKPKNALFKPRAKNEDEAEYFYRFHSALSKIDPINAEYSEKIGKICASRGIPITHDNLLAYLIKLEERNNLVQNVEPAATQNKRPSPKI